MTQNNSSITRRSMVAGSGALACCSALVACGGSSGSGSDTGPGPDVTVAAADVPVGGGLVDKTNNVVVTQPSKGTYKAFSSMCPHMGCHVGQVTKESIVCPCHGSTFDPATGEVTAGPAQSGLTARKVRLQGDSVHITG